MERRKTYRPEDYPDGYPKYDYNHWSITAWYVLAPLPILTVVSYLVTGDVPQFVRLLAQELGLL